MKTRFIRFLASAVLGGFLLSAFTAAAGPAPGELLRQAYVRLEHADHDYKGHRKAAMEQIEKAAAMVGMKVRGDGHISETQGLSDEHLRAAESLLQEARGGLRGKALRHANRALEHLHTALKIK